MVLMMVLSKVIIDITISSRSFVFSQSYVQISGSLTNISGLAVASFDLINCSALSFAWLISVLNVFEQLSQSNDRFASNTDAVGL